MMKDFSNSGLLLAPTEAQRMLEEGRDPVAVLARLDVAACSFRARVVTEAMPLVRTLLRCSAPAVTGRLAFSLEALERFQAAGEQVILAGTPKTIDVVHGLKDRKPVGTIPTSQRWDQKETSAYAHFLSSSVYYPSPLLDDPRAPLLRLGADGQTLQINGQNQLREGDTITMDPEAGLLWRGAHPVVESPLSFGVFKKAADAVCAQCKTPEIAFHLVNNASLYDYWKLEEVWGRRPPVGLYRREVNFYDDRIDLWESFLAVLKEGGLPIPMARGDINPFQQHIPMNYRLPDMFALTQHLTPAMNEAAQAGEDHRVGSPYFDMRRTVFGCYLYNATRHRARSLVVSKAPFIPLSITLPNITNVKEAWHLFKTVREAMADEMVGRYERGAMIESEEILRHTRPLAALCHSFSLGWGDLTASITGLPRGVFDQRQWMRAHGHEGNNPFEVLVPEVLTRVTGPLREAKQANPRLRLNACGHQTSWGHVPSLDLLMDHMPDIDRITVYPFPAIALRTRLALARHAVRRAGVVPAR